MKTILRKKCVGYRSLALIFLLVFALTLLACGGNNSVRDGAAQSESEKRDVKEQIEMTEKTSSETEMIGTESEPPGIEDIKDSEVEAAGEETDLPVSKPLGQTEGTGIVYPSANGHLVCIDAGHQQNGDSAPEPVAPGASETKARVSSGTTGRTTGVPEYLLTLEVALKLRDELIARGYGVVMTRETNEVNISNSERAGIARDAGVDSFVRLHANGSEDTSVNGAMTICQTASNPYTASLYAQSKSLSQNILDSFCAATGAKKQYVWETDTMSGINWSQVPVTILEMGYMTNPTEDANMSSAEYQDKMVQGIANGIDAYYTQP